jgi:hypothetical protein
MLQGLVDASGSNMAVEMMAPIKNKVANPNKETMYLRGADKAATIITAINTKHTISPIFALSGIFKFEVLNFV